MAAANIPAEDLEPVGGMVDLSLTEERFLKKRVSALAPRLVMGTVFHPLQCVKVLAQLGHEPLPLSTGHAWIFFGKSVCFLPNGIKYIKHIYKQKGFSGLYTGLSSNIAGNTVGTFASVAATIWFDRKNKWSISEESAYSQGTDEQALKRMLRRAFRESFAKVVGVIACRPFQVVMIRQMAQFVGGEEHYIGLVSSFTTIYQDEGIKGLFSGIFPQLLAELMAVWLLHSASLVIDRICVRHIEGEEEEDEGIENELQQLVREGEGEGAVKIFKKLTKFLIPYAVSSVIYPYQLVSTVMAVNGSGLSAAELTSTVVFGSWQDCWQHLTDTKQIKRGAKLLHRIYDGPITFRGGEKYAQNKIFRR